MPKLNNPIMCREVYQWPEFKALCERLGIRHSHLTKTMRIDMADPDSFVDVEHAYLADGPEADTCAEVQGSV